MRRLKDLILHSSDWASIDNEQQLLQRVSQVLQEVFGMDAGVFIYFHPSFIDEHESGFYVYEAWGLDHHHSQLSSMLHEFEWFSEEPHHVPDHWVAVTEINPVWKNLLLEKGINHLGGWNLIIGGERKGVMILGQKCGPVENDHDIMTVCATYVSFVLDMLKHRRIAEYVGSHDAMTKVFNRRGFDLQLHQLSQLHLDMVFGLLDVDYFKEINDRFGHLKGDSVLIDIAETLMQKIGDRGVISRFGGDEFQFVIKMESPNPGELEQRVLTWFAHKEYSISVGCTRWNGADWSASLREADERLYRHKLQNKLFIFNKSKNNATMARLSPSHSFTNSDISLEEK